MKYKAIIFDLDGTLINSLEDIADAMNKVLIDNDYPTHNYESYNYFIGNGLRKLVTRALPENRRNEEEIDRCYELMMDYYGENCIQKTKPYTGIQALLDELNLKSIPMNVLSNKSDVLTKKITESIFPEYFNLVVGLTSEEFKKPNPFTAIQMSEQLNCTPSEIIFVGDSGIDMQTATQAGMYAVGVSWGYRPKDELFSEGAKFFLNEPSDLMELF
ncbi:HAD-IA family hydrolase [Flavobacterium sp.]|uniref:HAD family hydrolase n=1 Tax=Flavobacterium sp. TaxID=239 RepID=UPI002CCFB14F|nr:HAD-IA family hydrolase [Flavobacterium sp.]HSD08952.1 HAD-IA family hydrolase [Flavobacterium sp.]